MFCAPVCVADEFVESDVLVCVLDALVDGVAVDVLVPRPPAGIFILIAPGAVGNRK